MKTKQWKKAVEKSSSTYVSRSNDRIYLCGTIGSKGRR